MMSVTQERVANPLIQAFLTRRGLALGDLDYLMNPNVTHEHDPYLLRGVSDWIDLLHTHKGEAVAVIPDYDADGVLSGTLARVGLSILGFGDVYVYPPKASDGYGMSETSVDQVLAHAPDTKVIVTTDNGSVADTGIAYAKSKGLVVLVTDHHVSKRPSIADAHVNPNAQEHVDETYPFCDISGTAVIYKVLCAYAKRYQSDDVTQALLGTLVFLVGVSTISDVMPLLDENRYYVTEAVNMLTRFTKNASYERLMSYSDTPLDQYFRGVELLVKTLTDRGRLKFGINANTFGYVIGPMLNSPRRMTGDSKLAFDLFQTTKSSLNLDNWVPPSDVLYDLNEERKAYVRTLTSGLFKHIEQDSHIDPLYFTVVSITTRGGVVGLLSGDFVKRYGLPNITFGVPSGHTTSQQDGEINPKLTNTSVMLSGSGRAPAGFDMYRFITHIDKSYPGLIETWGGHAQAVGITVCADKFDDFRYVYVSHLIKLLEDISETVDGAGNDVRALPLDVDFMIDTPAYQDVVASGYAPVFAIPITGDGPLIHNPSVRELIEFIEKLEPFGHGFTEPTFGLVFNIQQVTKREMGADKQHVKFTLPNGLSVIHWNGADLYRHDGFGDDFRTFAVEGVLNINHFNGVDTLQLITNKAHQLADL